MANAILKLGQLVDYLPKDLVDGVVKEAKAEGLNDVDELDVKRRGVADAQQQLEAGERAEVTRVSSRRLDRDNEILIPEGVVLTAFKRAPQVFWGHNYSDIPIGHDEWIKADNDGIIAKTHYVETKDPSLANVVWDTIKHGSLKTSSVGLVPLKSVVPSHNDWDRVVRRLQSSWKDFTDEIVNNTKRIVLKWILLEHSKVGIPSNIDAETIAVAKSAGSMIVHDLGWDGVPELADAMKVVAKGQPPEPDRVIDVIAPRTITVVKRHIKPVTSVEVVRSVTEETLDLQRGRV